MLERVERLRRVHDLTPAKIDDWHGSEAAAVEILSVLRAKHLRPEHRDRIYEDLIRNRDLLLQERDPRLIELIVWSEHVESLHRSLRRKLLGAFHYARALEATCRRCGFELLPLMHNMDELGKLWGGREYEPAWEMVSAHLVQVDPAGESPPELSPQL